MLMTAFGSFLFYTLATKLAMWGDILPILLFLLSTMYYLFVVGFKWTKPKTYFLLIGFLGVSVILYFPPFNKILNGSLLYAPTIRSGVRRRTS